ncbi:hypothetical protein BASA82_000218, partial [Batrachochytrium salamandrivorans]
MAATTRQSLQTGPLANCRRGQTVPLVHKPSAAPMPTFVQADSEEEKQEPAEEKTAVAEEEEEEAAPVKLSPFRADLKRAM